MDELPGADEARRIQSDGAKRAALEVAERKRRREQEENQRLREVLDLARSKGRAMLGEMIRRRCAQGYSDLYVDGPEYGTLHPNVGEHVVFALLEYFPSVRRGLGAKGYRLHPVEWSCMRRIGPNRDDPVDLESGTLWVLLWGNDTGRQRHLELPARPDARDRIPKVRDDEPDRMSMATGCLGILAGLSLASALVAVTGWTYVAAPWCVWPLGSR